MRISKTAELNALLAEWNEKLRQNGFRDIEDPKENFHEEKTVTRNAALNRTPKQRQCLIEHSAMMTHLVEDPRTQYRNDSDRFILRRYMDGVMIKTIVEELKARGTPKERKTVRIIIRRYEQAWNVRKYTDAQLNRKVRP